MGRLGLEKTFGNSTVLSSLRSRISKLTMEHSVSALAVSKVVSDSVDLVPFIPSSFKSCSVQKVVFEPLSKNAYVFTSLFPPFARTLTGTTASPVVDASLELLVRLLTAVT